MSEELKPCPFCGADASVQWWGGANQWVCGCWNDDCPLIAEVYARNRQDAIYFWNERAA